MGTEVRHWGRFSLSQELMLNHPVIVNTLMEQLSIESIIYNGRIEAFDFVASSPVFRPTKGGDLPPDHVFIFHETKHPLFGDGAIVELREIR